MRLRPDDLPQHLARGLAPVYLLAGAEPLLLQEAADAVRAAARHAGWGARQCLVVEAGFDWSALVTAAASLSLFAERRLLELRLDSAKPGEAGSRALVSYAAAPPPDVLLLVVAGRLDAAAQRSAWVRALEGAGVAVIVPAMDGRRLPDWLAGRLRARGFNPTREAVALLVERVEGNLLAAAQEVEKLALTQTPGPLTADELLAAVGDSARFDVYALADAALAGDSVRVLRVLAALRDEGVEGTLINWALSKELRALAAMAADRAAGLTVEAVLARHNVWEQRKPLLRKALARDGSGVWAKLLRRAARVDRLLKGVEPGAAWDELLHLALATAGCDPLGCELRSS
jgi:DNA polymerase-3 subunit delta